MHALLKPTKLGSINHSNNGENTHKRFFINPELSDSIKRNIRFSHKSNFDWKTGGTQSPIKFLDRDSVEYSMVMASQGNKNEEQMAKLTLDNALCLIDPIWGGVYQYSTKGWHSPHYSKTMNNQAGYLRIYALAYGLFHSERYRAAAFSIRDYLTQFLLSDSGGFYSAQADRVDGIDAQHYYSLDDTQRRQYGIPEIKKNRYARDNGWAIEALATLYEFSADKASLDLAIHTASWIIKHRLFPDGGFRHDKRDDNGPFLADSLAMARAMLQLYKVTQQEKWLIRTINVVDFISIYFKQRGGGFISHIERQSNATVAPQIDENISLMRLCNLLAHYSEMRRHRGMAKHCLRYLCQEHVAMSRDDEAGILLAEMEYSDKPIEIILFGDPQQETIQALLASGLRYPLWYKTIRRYKNWKSNFSWKPNPSQQKPFAIVQRDEFISDEITEPELLQQMLMKLQ